MSSQDKKWIVRDGKGHIFGPFTLAKLQELLRKGILSGEEESAHYPAGDWGPLSADPDLYEIVLEALAGPRPAPEPAAPARQSTAEKESSEELADDQTPVLAATGTGGSKSGAGSSGIASSPSLAGSAGSVKSKSKSATGSAGTADSNPSGFEESATALQKQKAAKKIKGEQPSLTPPPPPTRGSPPPSPFGNPFSSGGRKPRPDIELQDKKKIFRKKSVSANLVPLLLIVVAGLLLYVGTRGPINVFHRQTISLIMPHPKKSGFNQSKAEGLVKRGWGFFYKDTFSNYVRAEESFVEAVEENPQNADALSMLIVTDLQLWPFTKQDSSDQNIVQSLVQMISQVDRIGKLRSLAAAAMNLMLGQDTSARTQLDSALTADPADGRLYQMKGYLFFETNSFQEAAGYFEKASSLLPYWVQPTYMLGRSYSHDGNAPQAEKYLIQALKMNPGHAPARLELGIVEERFYNHDDKAREYLTVALDGSEKLAPLVESRGRYWLAVIMNKTGDVSGAKTQAKMALSLNPSDPDVRDLLGKLGVSITGKDPGGDREHMAMGDQYMRLGNFLGAQAQYKAAFAANPKNARAAMKAAEALWKFHQGDEAIEYLQKSIVADPKFIESYVVMADYKSRRYDFEGAMKSLEAAMKVNPKSYEVYRGFGEVMFRRGDSAGAESFVTKALALYEIDVKSNVLMSKVQLAKRDTVKATEYAKRAVELDKGDAEAQVNYAKVLAAYEGVRGGVEYLTDLINTYPTQLQYRIGLAEILIQDEQYAQAKTVLSQVTSADDKNKEAFELMGDASLLNSDLPAAVSDFLDAARIDPSDPTPLLRLGEVYLKANKPDKAVETFQQVLRANRLFPRAHYSLARAYFQAQLVDKAIDELEEEKKLNPRLADPYEFEGDLYLSTRKYAFAAREYQKASEIKNQGAAIYVKLAKAYRGQGSYDEAMAMLRLAAAKESGYAEIYKEYGYLYDAKDMADEAVTAFEQYLRLDPNSPDKQAILDKINELK